ncbi:hypothetical protein NOS3756_46690 [Nostoc sp. NIES-3756]|uniref:DUF5331 domain-containing protein n=1 Tax=Nostoc sp. NIES-3756 TaxID=1751286 RepID=UPI000721C59D|nr:DUF5331 domain-containing protein [Nostoc sp. NIES-3756]BAT55676.1 hypothetical protein NOS3756_46690 [Nostoc sp. NIES-3756]
MDIQGLRQSLKIKWLSYYEQNRSWLVKMRVWATYNGLRRPSSGFILATLSALEPEFEQVLTFIMELNNDPDEIVAALGLNFNPDTELRLTQQDSHQQQQTDSKATASNGLAVNTQYSESTPMLSLVQKPERSLTDNRNVNSQRAIGYTSPKINTVNANGNKIYSQPALQSLSDRHNLSPVLITDDPVKPTPTSLKLALAKTTPQNSKILRVLEITTKVPGQQKTLPLLKLATETTQNEQLNTITSTRKSNPSPNTNATTLASWVDEFCQGTGTN